jgi:hypothetical protein
VAVISISGEAGCPHEELARLIAGRLGFDLLSPASPEALEQLRAVVGLSPHGGVSARSCEERHVVLSSTGTEPLFESAPHILNVHVVGAGSRRLPRPQTCDVILNAEAFALDQMADALEAAIRIQGLRDSPLWSAAGEAKFQLQVRLKLAQFGAALPAASAGHNDNFGHPSERIFADLLDGYRIAWEYEPRSFPIHYDAGGKPIESFTPDFYLPEFDLYVELTTMKQSLVTKKNRKVRLLKELNPGINIQVFYQKDFENLIFKYGLAERPVNA